MKPATLGISLLVAMVLIYWTFLFFWQRSMLFPAPSASGAPARPPDAESIWFDIPHGRVEGWYLPPSRWESKGHAPLLVFTHGNGELIDDWPNDFEAPRLWGVGVLLVEYPGYGRSSGLPSERSVTDAVLAAYDWAVRQPSVDPKRVIAYGRSVGGGAATALAAARPVAALILESTFTSVAAFASRYGAPALLVRDRFDNLAAVRQFSGPVLILHGEHDETIPVSHGRALHSVQPRSEFVVMPCGHNDCERPWAAIRGFLGRHRLLAGL
jgi:pimeloyl-ACP methyl ester carboxylesterase